MTIIITILPIVCFVIFLICLYRDSMREETKLTDKQAQEVRDSLHRQIQEQEAARLLLIEREEKDVELDKED